MNRKCPNCGNEAAYLCDNCTDPLDCRYYCDKCGTMFSENGKIITEPKLSDPPIICKCQTCKYLGEFAPCYPMGNGPCERYALDADLYPELVEEGIEEMEKFVDKCEREYQVHKADAGKPKLTLVPRQIIYDIAEVREYGNNKYPEGGPDNWKKVDKRRYRDALFRHLLLYLDDPQGVDEESGIKHLKHIACNVAFLCELEACPEDEEYVTFSEAFKMKCPETWEGTLTFVGSTEKAEPHCNVKVTGKAEEDE